MKTFRMIGATLCALIACIAMTACSNENDNALLGNEEPDVYTVKLGMAGEILDITEEPLTRATGDDLYGIQVYSCPANAEKTTWTYYAYGLFDDIETAEIKLLNGYKYKFETSMIVDGKNTIYHLKNIENNDIYEYAKPFLTTGDNGGAALLNNIFNYSSSTYMWGLYKGLSQLNNDQKDYNRPNTERYYGILENFTPAENESAIINMKRTSFGAKYIVQGNFKKIGGTLSINMKDAPLIEMVATLGDTQEHRYENIYTFSDVVSAYVNDKYTETISIGMNFTKDDGVVIPLGEHKITFRRNKKTVVTIKLTENTTGSALGFSIDSTESTDLDKMTEEGNVTVEDGAVTETPVTPDAN